MLKEIIIEKERYSGYKFLNSDKSLSGLSKINIFIGQNNSGKSRFLRALFSDETFEFTLKKHDHIKLKELIGKKCFELREIFDAIYMDDVDNIFVTINKLHDEIGNFKIGKVTNDIEKIRKLAQELCNKTSINGYNIKANMISTRDPSPIIPQINRVGKEIKELLDEIFPNDFTFDIHKIYVPNLRGLRPIQIDKEGNFINAEDTYKLRTIKDYFPNDNNGIGNNIFTGLKLYSDTRKLLLGNKEGREKIKKFETFLSNSFFQDQPITLIPDIDKDVLLVGMGCKEVLEISKFFFH